MTDNIDTTDLTPREYMVLGPWLAQACGLPALEHGLLCCEREPDGRRVTLATADVEFLRLAVLLTESNGQDGVRIPPEKFCLMRSGWPNEWGPRPASGGWATEEPPWRLIA